MFATSSLQPDPPAVTVVVGQARASDAPRRAAGTRTRSGNAMGRTRSAILEAAAGCFATHGVRKTTMGDIAVAGAIAKATLYNHFRTKRDVLAALVESRIAAFASSGVELAQRDGLAAALALAAEQLASDPALRTIARTEAPLLLQLAVPDNGRGWTSARAMAAAVLHAAGVRDDPLAVEVVLRWLTAQVLWPAEPAQAWFAGELLAAGLVAPPPPAAEVAPNAVLAEYAPYPVPHAVPVPVPVPVPVQAQRGTGLGWPS